MSDVIVNDATVIEGLEACFFDDDFVQSDVMRGKESTAGRWTIAEHEMFVKGLEAHSKQWKLIAELIKTRTVVQVRTHAQKYFQKLLKQAKNDGSNISEDAFADMFNDSSSDSLAGLKRKGNSACPIKSKMKRADSVSSLSVEGQGRDSSDSDYRLRTEIEKKRKAKSDRTNSPTSRSVTEAEIEPYLNSYPIQMSNGSSYPQNNIVAEGNAPADWFNLGQPQTAETTQGLIQRYHQSTANPTYNTAPLFSATEPTQTGYTHGMDCNTNTAMYYQSQSYPTTLPQNSISHSIQQMDFPDPFGIGGGDLNGLDLCWLVDDMDLPDSAADVYNNRVPAFEREREIPHQPSPRTPSLTLPGPPVLQKVDSSNSVYCGETSSAFGSNEAYTSHEDSSLTSCTSSDDGCFDEFDATPSLDQSMCDAMAVITNSQRRRLSKSSLALNSIYNTTGDVPFNMSEIMTTGSEDKLMGSHPPQTQSQSQYPALSSTAALSTEITGWFKGDDEDLVLGIVEAFSS